MTRLADARRVADPDRSFQRQLRTSFVLFTFLVAAALGILSYIYLGALRDKALRAAIEKGEESAEEMARILEEEADRTNEDLYTIIRNRREVDAVIGSRVKGRAIVESWQIVDAEGRTVATGTLRHPLPEASGAGHPSEASTPSSERFTVERELLLSGKRAGLVRLFLSEPDLMQQVAKFQEGVKLRVLGGAGLTLVLLLLGFAYTARLLDRTRRIHDEAETKMHLASLGALAGGLAHEIRNPLNAMSMNAQLLEEEIRTSGLPLAEQWSQTLRGTRGEIVRLNGLVTDVLSYARPFKLKLEPVDLRKISEAVVEFLRPELDRQSVQAEIKIDSGIEVDLDPSRFRQALLNVVQNAVKAFDSKSLQTNRIVLGSLKTSREIRLIVEDNGPGIKKEIRDRILEPFVSGSEGGTGLGLPIASRIAQAHGGRLTIEELAPHGVRVMFCFPLRSGR